LEKNVGLNDSQDPEGSIHIFDEFLTLQTFLRNQQLKILRSFLNEPILIRVKKAKTLNQIKFRKPMPGRLGKISIPTRIQEVFIQAVEMTRYQYCLWPLYVHRNQQ
jgi:hypothetical protein